MCTKTPSRVFFVYVRIKEIIKVFFDMSENQFIPKMNNPARSELKHLESEEKSVLSIILLKVAQGSVISLFAFIPLFFVSGLWSSLGFDKAIIAIVCSLVTVVAISFLALKRKYTNTVMPVTLLLFWLWVAVAFVSGFTSGDVLDSIRGSVMEPQTATFLLVLGLTMSISLVLQKTKKMTLVALSVFGVSSTILLFYNLVRLFAGSDFLSLGSFSKITISPIGNFNDLAIFAGMMIVLGVITLAQLPVNSKIQYLITTVTFVSLFILMSVNFLSIWVLIGLFSLLVLLYTHTRNYFFETETDEKPKNKTKILTVTTSVVFVVSALFIFAGGYAGDLVSKLVSVDYVQVVPSHQATIDVARLVYEDGAMLGVGPNRFADAWRLYKNVSINDTLFWDTNFSNGSSFVSTIFVTLGILGGLLFVVFSIWFVYLGYKMLLRSKQQDPYWYYFGSVSFALALFVWVVSYIYVPGAAILLLGALFTGMSFVAAGSLLPDMTRKIPLVVNRRRGFFLMAVVIIVFSFASSLVFSVGKQYIAQANYAKAGVNLSGEEYEEAVLSSYNLFADDKFMNALAQAKLKKLNSTLAISEPTEEDEKHFLEIAQQTKLFAEEAVKKDETDPSNYMPLAGLYSILAIAGVPEAQDRAYSALAMSQSLDPINPAYRFIAAQIAANLGDMQLAREDIKAALDLKPDFSQALFLLAQLDINEGNVEGAIESTRSIIKLEQKNQTRYLQLGMLLSADKRYEEAKEAFLTAIEIDPNYANARYLLALVFVELGEYQSALDQLYLVEETNSDNENLKVLISQIESGEILINPELGFDVPVVEHPINTQSDDGMITNENIDTDLVVPVN